MVDFTNVRDCNYVRVANPKNNYWFDFSYNKLHSMYIDKYGDRFNIIISENVKGSEDFYIIPFTYLSELFTKNNFAKDNSSRLGKRWVGNIKNHFLKISNCSLRIDVKEYYSNQYYLNNDLDDVYANDYTIEDIKQEVNVRLKQSKFRSLVLENFNNRCCISGISEKDLLVASHIIPWSNRKDTRLNPLNGLCLSPLYDKLFDKGYFTLDEESNIVIVKNKCNISTPLLTILEKINGQKITPPIKKLDEEFMKYHRENIFLGRDQPV